MLCHQCGAGVDNQIEAASACIDRTDLLIRADRGGDGRVQLDTRQFGLGFVIIDIVIANRVDLRCIARLAGTQDDSNFIHAKRLTDMAYQLQAGVFLLHDHVKQDNRNIPFILQQFARLFGRVRMDKFERPVLHFQVAERECRSRVHVGVIINDHDAPDIDRLAPRHVVRQRSIRFVEEDKFFL